MAANTFILLDDRALLAIRGEDSKGFLQGLVTNDVHKVAPDQAIHAAFLTPQGKYLYDFFIAEMEGALVLDCEAARRGDLARRLGLYKLRSKVTIGTRDDLAVLAFVGDGTAEALGLEPGEGRARRFGDGVAFIDPRLAAAGARALLPRAEAEALASAAGFTATSRQAYDQLRIGLGLPDGSRDLVVDKALLLENGFEELRGVDFDKGCYMGQELTARTKYRALVRKRLVPVVIDGPAPEPGTRIMADEVEAGEMRSSSGGIGLALIRLEFLSEDGTLTAGAATLRPRKPAWAGF